MLMKKLLTVFALICVVLLSSCSLSPIKTAPMSTYTISDWKNLSMPVRSMSHKTLLITMPVAAPGYASSKMIYVMIPFELRAFGDHQWVASPAELLLPLMANRIRTTGYFHAVVTTPFSGVANYQLNTRLLMLQQEFLQPQSKVRLAMQATLLNFATGRVIASREFQAVVPASANNPYAGVIATNQAARTVMNQIAYFVVNNIKRN